ncbi:hypothetical protein [Streptomyces sp. 769]|uniref:hypothetical protein n=1 Tax=Streptomyces sp. 769 TaxID=1262452 RepID=UPI0005808B80|nr:hypothetical protein [Streptomyces sp. 769]AJC54018.1 hypothetical protein GZL_01418 [Streptomyces sp. 769]
MDETTNQYAVPETDDDPFSDPDSFNQIAYGVGPSLFGASIAVEWHTDVPGIRLCPYDADGELRGVLVWTDAHMPTDATGEPALNDAVLKFLKVWHRGVDKPDWHSDVPTLIWELADHRDLAWFGPTEIDRETRKTIGAY